MSLLEVENLRTYFKTEAGKARAVNGVSFTLEEGENLALIGESACGKSVTALSIMRLIEPPSGYHPSGRMRFEDADLLQAAAHCDYAITGCTVAAPALFPAPGGSQVACYLYDPYNPLPARAVVEDSPLRPPSSVSPSSPLLFPSPPLVEIRNLTTHFPVKKGLCQRVVEHVKAVDGVTRAIPEGITLGLVGESGCGKTTLGHSQIPPHAMRDMRRSVQIIFQDPFSSLNPRFTVQELVGEGLRVHELNLLRDLQARYQLTYLFITHDLGVIQYLAHAVAIMYLGRIVEYGETTAVFEHSAPPYTQSLLAAVPGLESRRTAPPPVLGDVPSPVSPPLGCHFHPRCPLLLGTTNAVLRSACPIQYPPPLRAGPRHWARCHAVEGEVVTNV